MLLKGRMGTEYIEVRVRPHVPDNTVGNIAVSTANTKSGYMKAAMLAHFCLQTF